MIAFLRAMIGHGGATNMVISQKGGGCYPNADICSVDKTGISATIGSKVHFIPWSSINEVREA